MSAPDNDSIAIVKNTNADQNASCMAVPATTENHKHPEMKPLCHLPGKGANIK